MVEKIASVEVVSLLKSDNDFVKMTKNVVEVPGVINLVLNRPELRSVTVIKFIDGTELYLVNYLIYIEPEQSKIIQKMEAEFYTLEGRHVRVAHMLAPL